MDKEILNKTFISAKDLKQLTGIGINQCTKIIKELKEQAIEDGYFIPNAKGYIAPTNLVKRKFRWR